MAHIEEGTIHAWLDGALSPDEAARVEGHVAGCAACGAAVAEARGLAAASSRILSALDEVPAGVIPRGVGAASQAPTASTTPATPKASTTAERPQASASGGLRRRPWYMRPQYAAAASMTILAVSAAVVMRRSERETAADIRPASEMTASAPAASPPVASAAAADSSPPAAMDAVDAVRGTAQVGVARGAAPDGAAPARADEVSPAVAQPDRKVAPAAAPAERAARRLALRPEMVTSAESARVRGEVALQQQRIAEPPAAPPAPRVAAPPAPAVAGGRAKSVDVERERRSANAVGSVAVTSSGAAVPASTVALAGCYRVERSEALRLAGVGDRWLLERLPAGSEGAAPTFLARELASADSTRAVLRDSARAAPARGDVTADAASWRWTPGVGGAVVLLEGRGPNLRRHVVMLSSERDAAADQARERQELSTTANTSRAVRITCPPR